MESIYEVQNEMKFNRLDDDEKLDFLLENAKVERGDIEDSFSHTSDFTEENKFYVCLKLEDMIISRDNLLQDHLYDIIESSGEVPRQFYDWDEYSVFDAALEVQGGFHEYIKVGDKYLAAGHVAWNNDADEFISRVAMREIPYLNKLFSDDHILVSDDKEEIEQSLPIIARKEKLEATLIKGDKIENLLAQIQGSESEQKKTKAAKQKI